MKPKYTYDYKDGVWKAITQPDGSTYMYDSKYILFPKNFTWSK